MKKALFLAILSMIFVQSAGMNWSHASADLGEPGCLRPLQGRAVNDSLAKLLPKKCQTFRKFYTQGLNDLAHQPKKFAANLQKTIESAHGPISPYSALVLAVISQNPKQNETLMPALEKRAAIEARLKLNYPYAVAALEKIKTGECKNFTSPVYSELCSGNDAAYARMVALNQVEPATNGAKKK